MKEVTVEEIYAFIGLYLNRGLYKLKTISSYFLMTFVLQYLVLLCQGIRPHLSFDDETTRENRWQHDRFAAMSEVSDFFNFEYISYLVPGDYLSLDETLYPMSTQISFKQHNPNKTAKYGVLLKAINAARYPYTFIAAPYCGKLIRNPREYYVSGTFEVVKKMVHRLESVVSLAERNISSAR